MGVMGDMGKRKPQYFCIGQLKIVVVVKFKKNNSISSQDGCGISYAMSHTCVRKKSPSTTRRRGNRILLVRVRSLNGESPSKIQTKGQFLKAAVSGHEASVNSIEIEKWGPHVSRT